MTKAQLKKATSLDAFLAFGRDGLVKLKLSSEAVAGVLNKANWQGHNNWRYNRDCEWFSSGKKRIDERYAMFIASVLINGIQE